MDNKFKTKLTELILSVCELEVEDKINALNTIKEELHKISPFKNEPVDCVLWIKNERVHANSFNPNTVFPKQMKLLELSIATDGFTMPIVSDKESENKYEIVDGYHRNKVGKEHDIVKNRVLGYLPLAIINKDTSGTDQKISSCIRHNAARGVHAIPKMSEIIKELKRRKWSPAKIAEQLGMDMEEVTRLAQLTGLAEMFADREFSKAWESSEMAISE